MRLTTRALNRTLWVRQQLVPAHSAGLTDPVVVTEHLLGLQAQENLAPCLSLAARMPAFDPMVLSDAIATRQVVRILSMRGTVHILSAADALALRPWLQPTLDASARTNAGSRAARDIATPDLAAATAAALAGGPLPLAELGDRLAAAFPEVETSALRAAVRSRMPVVQVPPRGLWRRSGGVVYDLLTTWVGRDATVLDRPELVRRYLRAFGPATAADLTKWSAVTGFGPVVQAMRAELVQHTTDEGRTLWDVPDGVHADPDLELPPLLLGNYDNLWLSHADRRRITTDENRLRWMGPNGGIGAAVFVDGMLEGVWHRDGDDVVVTGFRPFTVVERSGIDAEIGRIRDLLAR